MKSTVYEMDARGRLVEMSAGFENLEPGTVITWGGNYAYPETTYCVIGRIEGSYGVQYECYNLDNENANALLNRVEARSIKSRDDASIWHSQHYFIEDETRTAEQVESYKSEHARQAAEFKKHEDEAKAEADRLEAIGRKLWPSLIGDCPAVIVAELEHDESDMMTDYFGSRTVDRVILAPSKHKRDLFPEMRKAAELIEETAHLGPGKGRFNPYVAVGADFTSNGSRHYKGSRSHWHGEMDRDEHGNSLYFLTREAAEDYIRQCGEPHPISFDGTEIPFTWEIQEDEIEHREKYSMGKGYYLGYSSHSGWNVSKEVFYNGSPRREDYICLARRHDHLTKGEPKKEAAKPAPKNGKTFAPVATGKWDAYKVTMKA